MRGRQSAVDQAAPMVLVDGPTNFLKKPQPGKSVQLLLVAVSVDGKVFRDTGFALSRLTLARAWGF